MAIVARQKKGEQVIFFNRSDDTKYGKCLELVLSNDNDQSPAKQSNSFANAYDRENNLFYLTGTLEPETSGYEQILTPSSIALYFKSISKYRLLNEEEEKNLARMIKHLESECNRLLLQWRTLLQKKFLGLFPVRQNKVVLAFLRREHSFITFFDEVLRLVKERKKIEHLLDQPTMALNVQSELQEALKKAEAEISKVIAKMKIGETSVNKFMRDIESIPYKQGVFKKRKEIEIDMRKTLRDIHSVVAEIKSTKNQMVKANLRLVISIAKKYLNQGVALADLIQEGNLGLMRAIDTYDYLRGHRLVTYATWWIKQAMIRAIDCQSKTVRTPVYVNEKLNQIMKASNRLLQECKREPTLSEIAAETNTPVESLEKVLKSTKDYIPLEYLVEDQSDTVVDAAQDFSSGSIPAQVASDQLADVVNDLVLSDLTERERDIVKLRFGIGKEHDHTLEEIGRAFKLSRERIRQILETALRKMRTPEQLMLLREFANPN